MVGFTKNELTKTEKKVLKLFGIPVQFWDDDDHSRFMYDEEGDIYIYCYKKKKSGKGKKKVKVELYHAGGGYFTTPKKALKDVKKYIELNAKLAEIGKGEKEAKVTCLRADTKK